jgi:hypothetical protein
VILLVQNVPLSSAGADFQYIEERMSQNRGREMIDKQIDNNG